MTDTSSHGPRKPLIQVTGQAAGLTGAAGSVGPRFLLAAAAAPLVVLVLLGFVLHLGGAGYNTVTTHIRTIVKEDLAGSIHLMQISQHVQTINGRFYRLTTLQATNQAEVDIKQEFQNISTNVGEVIGSLAAYRDQFAKGDDIAEINQAISHLGEYKTAVEWVGWMLEIDFQAAVSFIKPFNDIFDRLSDKLGAMTQAGAIAANTRGDQAAADIAAAIRAFLFLVCGTIVAVFGAAWLSGVIHQRVVFNTRLLEEQVAVRTRQLAGRTRELEESLNTLHETQRQLVIKEKMASLGRLVTGVAHEINTPLGTALVSASHVTLCASNIRARVDAGGVRRSDFHEFLKDIDEATGLLTANLGRVAKLVNSFKLVAVDQTREERRRVDLREHLADMAAGFSLKLATTPHRLRVDCPAGVVFDSYPGALFPILSEFIDNALFHAFPDDAAKDKAPRAGALSIRVTPQADGWIELRLADDGVGIPEDILPKVFDPFFTTGRGRGAAGLGLHIVFNTVTQRLGGAIAAESAPGQGTTLVLRLPCVAPVPPDTPDTALAR